MNETYLKYWGKARRNPGLASGWDYHLLAYHCLDVAAVGRVLLRKNRWLLERSAESCGLSTDALEYVIILSLLLHDLGKFSHGFQSLVPYLYGVLFPEKAFQPYNERHDTIGFIVWRDLAKGIVQNRNPVLARLLDVLMKAGTGHHGLPPKESGNGGNRRFEVRDFCDNDDIFAIGQYVESAMALLGDAPLIPTSVVETSAARKMVKYVSWQVAGIAVLADWIGSNTTFFRPEQEWLCKTPSPLQMDRYWSKQALQGAAVALEDIDWRSHSVQPFEGIHRLFSFIKTPTPLQRYVAEAEIPIGPQLWIIEDVTGAGKTEAAMILAQRLMHTGRAHGLYVALPTMATANAMYGRMISCYGHLYSKSERPSLILAHGHRDLNNAFKDTVGIVGYRNEGNVSDGESNQAYCNEWLADNRKKALLADVGVGTIDQALLAVLPARHQALRILGLLGKVLIVDEVHACDPYMEHLLEVLLQSHARNGGSAILLSATIPNNRRAKLKRAFSKGLVYEAIKPDEVARFPLVSVISASSAHCEYVETREEVKRRVDCRFVHTVDNVCTLIIEAAGNGKCVCWVRNTVDSAKEAYRKLISLGLNTQKASLFHSRFAMIDRVRIEDEAKRRFGKLSGVQERTGQVLVATQVVEQSLDLDFDVMVSDLAPIDLLIQRAGRLQRHVRDVSGDPKEGCVDDRGIPVLYVHTPNFDSEPDSTWLSGEFSGTQAVYGHVGRLWLGLRAIDSRKGWTMPDDARELIEAVYSDTSTEQIPAGLVEAQLRADGKGGAQVAMGHLNALVLEKGYSRDAVKADQWSEEEKISTRLSDESVEIILAVPRDNKLEPYAAVANNKWDWSALNISCKEWKRAEYVVPAQYAKAVEDLQQNEPRLKHSKIVVVGLNSSDALVNGTCQSEYYDPHFGWGFTGKEES